MKNLLNYQSSEYDCAPVSVTNGIRYLFEREEIYPDMIKGIMIYGMDSYNDQGEPCKYGTSPACMEFMADWLTRFGQMHNFPISCHTVSGDNVALKEGSPVLDALEKGGAVALRLYLEVPHYVLATGVEDDCLLLFNPFYEEPGHPEFDAEYHTEGITFIFDQPKKANRKVALSRLNGTGKSFYEMGDPLERKALIMFNTAAR